MPLQTALVLLPLQTARWCVFGPEDKRYASAWLGVLFRLESSWRLASQVHVMSVVWTRRDSQSAAISQSLGTPKSASKGPECGDKPELGNA